MRNHLDRNQSQDIQPKKQSKKRKNTIAVDDVINQQKLEAAKMNASLKKIKNRKLTTMISDEENKPQKAMFSSTVRSHSSISNHQKNHTEFSPKVNDQGGTPNLFLQNNLSSTQSRLDNTMTSFYKRDSNNLNQTFMTKKQDLTTKESKILNIYNSNQ